MEEKIWFEKGEWHGEVIVHTPLRSEEFKYDTRGDTISITTKMEWNSRFGADTLYDKDIREAFRYMPWEVLPVYDGEQKYAVLREEERIEFVSSRLNKILPYYEKYGRISKDKVEDDWHDISCFPAHEFLENIEKAKKCLEELKKGQKRSLIKMTVAMQFIEEAEEFLQKFLAGGGKI